MRTTNDEELHIVDIEYKNNKVKQICEDFGYAKKQYGEKVAKATAMGIPTYPRPISDNDSSPDLIFSNNDIAISPFII